jgi:hypothetical protein
MGGAAAGGAENTEAEEVHDESKVVEMKPNTENNAE